MSEAVPVEVLDADPATRELVPYETPAAPGLFGTDDPELVIARAVRVADALERVIREKNLIAKIRQNEHVLVEGWTLLGSMLGVFPVLVWTRPLEDGWEARVEARTLDGRIVGAAESECLRSESRWAKADDYAVRSMAATRATSKALRQPLGFVMTMAGFETTPAEEAPAEQPEPSAVAFEPASAEQLDEITTLIDRLHFRDASQDWNEVARMIAGGSPGSQLARGQAETVIARLRERLEGLRTVARDEKQREPAPSP
jgi:hypothetical protein